MNLRFLSAILVATPFTTVVACTDSESLGASEATLTENGDTGNAEGGWYGTKWAVQYAAYRPMAEHATQRFHHLDVHDWLHNGPPISLETGKVYVDGPTVNGRGKALSRFIEDPELYPSIPVPWIDLLACDGDTSAYDNCTAADKIEFWIEEAGDNARRYHYLATMPGETEPTVSGTFVGVNGTMSAPIAPRDLE